MQVVQWLSEMFSIEKEASKVNALEMSEDPEEKMMPLVFVCHHNFRLLTLVSSHQQIIQTKVASSQR